MMKRTYLALLVIQVSVLRKNNLELLTLLLWTSANFSLMSFYKVLFLSL